MKNKTAITERVSRRAALKGLVGLGALALAPSALLNGCSKSEKKKLVCVTNDPNAKNLKYVQVSPFLDKNCQNCALFEAGPSPDTCGNCQLIKGQIYPMGYCESWAEKKS